MNQPGMDLTDLLDVVINQTDKGLRVRAADTQLLSNLALHPIEKHLLAQMILRLVDGIDVPADANAALGHESLLTALAPARVAQVAPRMVEDRIRNQLLVRGVDLGCWALHEEVVLRV